MHISEHYRNRGLKEFRRPDFFVIEYLRKKRIISVDDYEWATRDTERPYCDGLVDLNYFTPEKSTQRDKNLEQIVDLEKEERQRRRQKSLKSRLARPGK